MELDGQIGAALITAAGALVLAAATVFWKQLAHHLDRQRQTRIQYLYPLKLACDDLLERWRKIAVEIEDGHGGELMAEYRRVAPSIRDGAFYRNCNGYLCGPVGTMHATACYFAYAVKLREQLPMVEVRTKKATALLRSMEDVRTGLASGDQYGFWTEIQDNIGRLVTVAESGRVIPFDSFCSVLARGDGSFDRLFEYYEHVESKYLYQLRPGYLALAQVVEVLRGILKTPPARPLRQPSWLGSGSAKVRAAVAAPTLAAVPA